MRLKRKSLASAIALTSLTLSTPSLQAAENLMLEEIIVTAQKRAEGLQDVPISINAVSGEKLESYNISSLGDLSGSIPNLQITKTGITNQIGMRGVYSGSNKGFEQSVAMYVDEVYYGRGQLIRLPLVDLERVEVLRGPQPTLFGKNAIAGAISLTSAKPTREFEASISTLYEFEHDESKTVAIVSGPLSEQMAGRLVLSYRDMDGWMTNTSLKREEPNTQETYARGTLLWENDDNLSITLKAETAEFDTAGRSMENHTPVGTYSLVPDFADVDTRKDYKRQDNGQESDNQVNNLVLNIDYDLGDYTLTSTTASVEFTTRELIDVDYTDLDVFNGTNQGEDFKQFSQEFRIASPADGNFDYIAGLYYQDSKSDVFDNLFFGDTLLTAGGGALATAVNGVASKTFEQDSEVWSAFAQFNWRITDQLTLTAGGRYSDEEKDGSRTLINDGSATLGGQAGFDATLAVLGIYGHSIEDTRNESQFDPLVNLQYDWSDDTMFYLSYTEGSKAGGFDMRSNNLPGAPASPGTFEFEDEQASSYELGGKFRFERGEINAAIFHTTYEDLQITQFDGSVGFNVQNAAEAIIQGVEIDGRFLLMEDLLLSASVAYLDYEYQDYDVAECAPAVAATQTPSNSSAGLCNFDGERAANTPEFAANLSLDYSHSVGDWGMMYWGLNLDYSDDYYASSTLDPNSLQDSYVKVGARISLASSDDSWELALIGNNLTDERVLTQSTALPLSETLTGDTGVAYYGIYERPRSVSMEFSYNF
ncbi:MAG: TonB-dependent receptor [Candidatus Pelagadaptatus aseana]|uniref:TonB-dependent receptor n=1 Tax=Candidatus Pelagadaptatus aseana TaxID=3120508 RepID=UPI0039B1EAE0